MLPWRRPAVTRDSNGTRPTFDAAKSLAPQPGSFGWRVHDGEGGTPDRSAAVAYRSDYAQQKMYFDFSEFFAIFG